MASAGRPLYVDPNLSWGTSPVGQVLNTEMHTGPYRHGYTRSDTGTEACLLDVANLLVKMPLIVLMCYRGIWTHSGVRRGGATRRDGDRLTYRPLANDRRLPVLRWLSGCFDWAIGAW